MYKYWIYLLILLLAFSLFPLQINADTDDVIKIAGDENYPPYEFVDKNGTYKGFNVDIMKAIAIELGIDIELIPMPWQDALAALEDREVDVIQGMTRSTIREEKYSFTEALVKNTQAIFVRSDRDNISELDNLVGLTISIQSGDISEELINKTSGITFMIFKDQEQAIDALLNGKVEAFVGNRLTGLYILQSLKQTSSVKIVGDPLYPTEYASATLKENKKVMELLNRGLENIKKNGQYKKIYHKWFGEVLVDYGLIWKRALLIGGSVSIIIIVIIVLVFYWNISLTKKVALRTDELAAANNELYKQQEKLDQSNRFRGKILENILDGIITFDQNGRLLGLNIAAKEFLQISNKELETIEDFKLINGLILEGCKQALLGNKWKHSLEWEKGAGEYLNIDCSIYPIKGPNDVIDGIIIVLHDYTESKLLNEAKEYEKLRTEFFANMSHEFRTPLSVIHAAAQLLQLNANTYGPSDLKKAIEKSVVSIKQNINRLTRLINNIIDVTRADTGFLQLQLKNNNIVNVVEEVTLSVVDLIENKGISIEFDTDVEERMIACDADIVERIVLNLLSNSVKFTPYDGKIYVKITDGEEYVTISVRDTGMGIPKDKQDIIFERFRQVDKSISRSNEGSGIGLSLVKTLVVLHGGSIEVDSTFGHGSEFVIRLPIRQIEDDTENSSIEIANTKKIEIEFSDIYL